MSEKKVKIIVSESGGGSNIPLIEAGTHAARCYSMVQIGTVKDEFKGKPLILPKIRISFELPNETHIFKEENGEQRRVISKVYRMSLNSKATLRKDLEAWRGKEFTKEELGAFDVTNVVGAACSLSIVHKTPESGGDPYSKIQSVGKPMKGMNIPELENAEHIFAHSIESDEDYLAAFSACNSYTQDQIVESDEWKARGLDRPVVEETETGAETIEQYSEDETTTETATGEKPPF